MSFQLSGIAQRYRGKTVLEIESLEIADREVVGIAGPNGSGKTTLLKLLACLEKPHCGEVCYQGRSTRRYGAALRREIALVHAEPYLLDRSVFENIAYGLRLRGQTDRLSARVEEALEQVGLFAQRFIRRTPAELSSGEAQRVAIASRLVLKPKVLLLDEPTKSLDLGGTALLARTLETIRGEMTLVIASHDRSWIERVSDRMVYLFHGRQSPHRPENFLIADFCADRAGWLHYEDARMRLCVPPREERSIAPMVPPEQIAITYTKPEGAENWLEGTVAALHQEPLSQKVMVVCQCGTWQINALSDNPLPMPGQKVWLSFGGHSVAWY